MANEWVLTDQDITSFGSIVRFNSKIYVYCNSNRLISLSDRYNFHTQIGNIPDEWEVLQLEGRGSSILRVIQDALDLK